MTVGPSVDLESTFAGNLTVRVGESGELDLDIENHAVTDASNVVVDITVIGGASITAADSTLATCSTTASGASCSIAALIAQGSMPIDLTVAGDSSGTATVTAMATADEPDQVAGDNTDQATVTVSPVQQPNNNPGGGGGGGGSLGWLALLALLAATRGRCRWLRR